jgi:hypothetical protein
MMIGNAKESEGLYYFEEAHEGNQLRIANCDSTSTFKESEILLWHFRMDHPDFQYMKHLFPFLFLNKKLFDSQCEICELAKHHRTPFLKSEYKPTKPFTLIHSDVWGPYHTPDRNHLK